MSTNKFHIQGIDHVELFVPDRHEAAKWFNEVLEFEIVPAYEDWAKNKHGPLMISPDGGNSKLALFIGEPQGSRETAGHHRVAFGVDAAGFIHFLKSLQVKEIFNQNSHRVTERDVVDHIKAFSIYFCDPYGHRFEITTYDYDEVTKYIAA